MPDATKHKYLEVVAMEGKVVRRIDVTGWRKARVEKMEDGITGKLDNLLYFTRVVEYNEVQPTELK